MNHNCILASIMLVSIIPLAHAGQAPFDASATDFTITGPDRVYAAEQF